MKFDDLLENHVGAFGKGQCIIYLYICLPAIWSAVIVYYWTFIGTDVPHRCAKESPYALFAMF